jgi:hypothetical protein
MNGHAGHVVQDIHEEEDNSHFAQGNVIWKSYRSFVRQIERRWSYWMLGYPGSCFGLPTVKMVEIGIDKSFMEF